VAGQSRHRVTIDLRGTDERLKAFAAARHLTIAASVRRAIDSMLAGDGEADNVEHLIMEPTANGPVVKVTLRLPPAHARLIAIRARRADVSQGEYVAGLVEGTPPTPLMPRHGEVVAELSRSTSVMAALGVDLNHVAGLMRSGATTNSEQQRANYELLRDVVREHVVLASQLIADVKSTGRVRLLDRNRRSG
jgi:hypothetical protein